LIRVALGEQVVVQIQNAHRNTFQAELQRGPSPSRYALPMPRLGAWAWMRPIALAANQSPHVGLLSTLEHRPGRRQCDDAVWIPDSIQGHGPACRGVVDEEDYPAASPAARHVHLSDPWGVSLRLGPQVYQRAAVARP
jgi:hypothetical protein